MDQRRILKEHLQGIQAVLSVTVGESPIMEGPWGGTLRQDTLHQGWL